MRQITREDVLMGRDKQAPLTADMERNLQRLLQALNALQFGVFQKQLTITSGYRPPTINAAAGGASRSTHMTCQAADIAGVALAEHLAANTDVLQKLGLYLEDPAYTWTANGGWCHVQITAPKSGRRVFQPYPGPPKNPKP